MLIAWILNFGSTNFDYVDFSAGCVEIWLIYFLVVWVAVTWRAHVAISATISVPAFVTLPVCTFLYSLFLFLLMHY